MPARIKTKDLKSARYASTKSLNKSPSLNSDLMHIVDDDKKLKVSNQTSSTASLNNDKKSKKTDAPNFQSLVISSEPLAPNVKKDEEFISVVDTPKFNTIQNKIEDYYGAKGLSQIDQKLTKKQLQSIELKR